MSLKRYVGSPNIKPMRNFIILYLSKKKCRPLHLAWTRRRFLYPPRVLVNGGLTSQCDHSKEVSEPHIYPVSTLANLLSSTISGYYPQLIALYKRLGVVFRPADFSYSFSSLSRARTHRFTHTAPTNAFSLTTTMLYNGASGREGLSMPSSMRNWHSQYKEQHTAVRAAVGAYTYPMFVLQTMQIAICYLWMLLCTVPVFRFRGSAGGEDTMTFKQWAEWRAPKNIVARWAGIDLVWGAYFRRVLVPLFSAVCTAPEQDVLEHPVEEFLGLSIIVTCAQRN